jgi:hypothetical protein
MGGRPVSDKVIAEAHEEYMKGVPYKALCERYGLARSTLIHRFRVLGYRGRGGRRVGARAGGPKGLKYQAYIEFLLRR